MMEFEADRMTGLDLDDEVVAPERDVVLEERRMRVETDPSAQLSEAMAAALFVHHPYGMPIIGWMHEIEELDREHALAYYRRFYTPENAILVVAGDVDAGRGAPSRRDAPTAAQPPGGAARCAAPARARAARRPPRQGRRPEGRAADPAAPLLTPSARTAQAARCQALEVLAEIARRRPDVLPLPQAGDGAAASP